MKWPQVTLKDVSTRLQYGYTASAKEDDVGPKFLRITDIVPLRIDWSTVPHCRIDEVKAEKYKLATGDIVIARTGNTTGYAKLIRDGIPAVFASYLVRVRVDPSRCDSGYVGRLVESDLYKRYVNGQRGGAAQGNANAQVLAGFRFGLPPLPVQRKIVNILSAYDDLMENNARRIRLLEDAARLLYEEWFVRLRFPGHEHTPIHNGLPEGWQRKPLSAVAEMIMGQSPPSKLYNEDGEGLPFHQGVTDFGDRFVTHRIYTTATRRIVEASDILCSVRAPVGRLNIAPDKLVIGRGLAALRSRTGHQSLLYYQLKHHFFKEDLIGGGAIFASVSKKVLEQQELLIPTNRLVREFEDFSRPIDDQIRILWLQNQKLQQARDLLLPRLMDGEIAV